MNHIDDIAEVGPLAETEGHAGFGRLDFAVLSVGGLIEFADVYAAVAGSDGYVVRATDVALKLDGLVTLSYGANIVVDVRDYLTQCRPSEMKRRHFK